MIATNNTNTDSGGTGDYDLKTYATSSCEDYYENEEEEVQTVENFKFQIFCGAVVRWCGYCFKIIYWKVRHLIESGPQIFAIKPLYLSGYMSEHRGLHWSRKERYGLK